MNKRQRKKLEKRQYRAFARVLRVWLRDNPGTPLFDGKLTRYDNVVIHEVNR
jgi:hypothetical protein